MTTPATLTRQAWVKQGAILSENPGPDWIHSHPGSTSLIKLQDNQFHGLITGRDRFNRSGIGKIRFDLDTGQLIDLSHTPLLTAGSLGQFDENGVSYPHVVRVDDQFYVYYTGWRPGQTTPFLNQVGLAIFNADWSLYYRSSAPILPLTDATPLGHGSVWVEKEEIWKMWVTTFTKWTQGTAKPEHQYSIYYAESEDGINWDLQGPAISPPAQTTCACHPTLIRDSDYHLWFCYKTDFYQIGYARSNDGRHWDVSPSPALPLSASGMDHLEMCYPTVFKLNNKLVMLYAGNYCGQAGLAWATLDPCQPLADS